MRVRRGRRGLGSGHVRNRFYRHSVSGPLSQHRNAHPRALVRYTLTDSDSQRAGASTPLVAANTPWLPKNKTTATLNE